MRSACCTYLYPSHRRPLAVATLLLLSSMMQLKVVYGNTADLESILAKIEVDTYTFAHKMEDLILTKCNFTADETCYKRSYHVCDSELSYATCPGKDLAIKQCGSGQEGGCGGLFDFTRSIVSVAPNANDPYLYQNSYSDRIKDGVCSTLRVEDYMKQITEDSKSYWKAFDVIPPSLYYGSDDGVFRIFPGSPGTCPNGNNDYDPRIRPWYIAASSGPKDVILVLDTSGSMKDYRRMEIMQAAAKRVVNTLGVSDHFAVIQFNSRAKVLGSDYQMIRATDKNKAMMIKKIDKLSANGGTNFYSGFDLAFRTFESSISEDRSSGCQRALLFLSDGIAEENEATLLNLINSERAKYTNKSKNPPVLFTYSFGANADTTLPKKIACQNNGIWNKISDGGDLSKSMGSYYKYFAYGLGDKINENFVAWVEPYEFSTGVGMGTTASAPVYDRTVNPPVLAGVVGIDINFLALERAFGGMGSSQSAVISAIVQRSGATCPKFNATKCQLESLRVYGGTEENIDASCSECSSIIQPLQAPLCDYYPDELWDNSFNRWRTFEERTCCNVGAEPRTKNNLTDEEIKNGVCREGSVISSLIGTIIGVVSGFLAVVAIAYFFIRSKRKNLQKNSYFSPTTTSDINLNSSVTVMEKPVQANFITSINNVPISTFAKVEIVEEDIVALPPPTAPKI